MYGAVHHLYDLYDLYVPFMRAGGRRLFGFSGGELNPNLRGVSKGRGVAQVLPAAEVSKALPRMNTFHGLVKV